MSVAFLLDQHVQKGVANGLRLRGMDVLTAFEDGSHELRDPALLDRALVLGRVLVTQDQDFLVIATERISAGVAFAGVLFAPQTLVGVGALVRDLELIAKTSNLDEFANQLVFLPL